jgi:UDP-N-acetylglucosamine 2-epimerase (hydrolysing)
VRNSAAKTLNQNARSEVKKKIVFLTGTRADFGKLKSLMRKIEDDSRYELHVFVTGMHMLTKYGYTCAEVENEKFSNIFKYINQNPSDRMDNILAKTIAGLSDYFHEIRPDLLVIHGDRVEALAGASVGALNNVLVGHLEGGEVSGTVDELIRHAVTKLSHIHFVANDKARDRLTQLGERKSSIYIIGSPDVDAMTSSTLPSLTEVKQRYQIGFEEFGIVLFHPVTSEVDDLRRQTKVMVDDLIDSGLNYVVIYPNNDHGTDIILEEYQRLRAMPQFRMYPSIRFEHFLTLMKNAVVIVGNSSAGVREAPHLGLPAINIGTRQRNRVDYSGVVNVEAQAGRICEAIRRIPHLNIEAAALFGDGRSAELFHEIVGNTSFWQRSTQKYFVDRM